MSEIRYGMYSRKIHPHISILTPTIPGREALVEECERSVRVQTANGWEHLILLDEHLDGLSTTMNRLAAEARGRWLFVLADDDLLLPRCVEQHMALSKEADVVYAPPLVWGEDAAQFCGSPPNIPATALIRKTMWDQAGGYKPELHETEDRDLWERLMSLNARFVRFGGAPTWIYRFWGQNKSRQ